MGILSSTKVERFLTFEFNGDSNWEYRFAISNLRIPPEQAESI